MDERRLREISKAWKSGCRSVELAERFGYKTPQNAAIAIVGLRKRHPKLFPRKRKVKLPKKRLATIG